MTEFIIIANGYAREKGESYQASSTTVVLKDSGKTILVDPGAHPNLLELLNRKNIDPNDIDMIYLTHYHPDHWLNIRLFPNTPVFDNETKWVGDIEEFHESKIPNIDIGILSTPGHAIEHSSLVFKNKEYGTVCLAQDVFWWEDGKQDDSSKDALLNLEDPYAYDMVELKKSRKKVLDLADYVIPGHGKPFKTDSL